MYALLSLASVLTILLVVGTGIGLLDRRRFDVRWLLIAAALVAVNDLALTRCYGLIPDVVGGRWNWTGKLLALGLTLAVASLPAFGWRRAGLTLRQAPGSVRACLPVVALYVLFFLGLALAFPGDAANGETIAFQLTMPGLEEEPFYRGILLLALGQAFGGRWRWLGAEWHWGVVLSALMFGLAHGWSYGAEGLSVDPVAMALTGVPALLLTWVRLRSGSVAWLVGLHNFGNAIDLIV